MTNNKFFEKSERLNWPTTIAMVVFHIGAIAALFCFTWKLFFITAGLYWATIGLGISLYGMAYFFVHDVFIHQRIAFLRSSNNTYLKAIRRAHKAHHKHLGKEDGECFGMLWVPLKYFRMYSRRRRPDPKSTQA